MLHRSGLPGWLRALLAVLVVLASFMHLTRSAAIGGLGAEIWQVAARALPGGGAQTHAGHSASARLAGSRATPDMGPGCCEHAHHRPPEAAGESGHDDHHQAAHCPFCLSSAFALEAGLAGLPQGPPNALPQPLRNAQNCVVIARTHADARAPPFEL